MTKTAYFYHDLQLKHDFPGHPETAGRAEAIMRRIRGEKYFAELELSPVCEISHESLELVHQPEHWPTLREAIDLGRSSIDADTYLTLESLHAAEISCGSLEKLAFMVADGHYKNGFALIRPPGHHATPGRAMGFCLLSNIAVAAASLLKHHKTGRLAILDFDVHHGNGTEDCLTGRKNIFFISSHQNGIYPGSGRPDNSSNIMNLPLPAGTADDEYLTLTREVILPALAKFKPEMLLVSAGYDAHKDDPLAGLSLSSDCFGQITAELVNFCAEFKIPGPLYVLEGGYNLTALAESVSNSFQALLGQKTDFIPTINPEKIRPEFRKLTKEFRDYYKKSL